MKEAFSFVFSNCAVFLDEHSYACVVKEFKATTLKDECKDSKV